MATLSGALRGRAWRQEESGEIEEEEEDEEEEDVEDEGKEGRKKKRSVFLAGCGAAYLRLETLKEEETKTNTKKMGERRKSKRSSKRVRKGREKNWLVRQREDERRRV